MRKLKFRAWGIDDAGLPCRMWYSDNFSLPNFFALCGEMSLMQSTGLHDKNGTEIYEGDILKMRVGGELGTWAVEYLENAMQFVFTKDPGEYEKDIGRRTLQK
jgi:YopX protein